MRREIFSPYDTKISFGGGNSLDSSDHVVNWVRLNRDKQNI